MSTTNSDPHIKALTSWEAIIYIHLRDARRTDLQHKHIKKMNYAIREQIIWVDNKYLTAFQTDYLDTIPIWLWVVLEYCFERHLANVIKIMTIIKRALWLHFGYKLLLFIFFVRLMWLKNNPCIDLTVLLCADKIMRWWDRSNTLCWLIADNNNTALDKLSLWTHAQRCVHVILCRCF